MQRAHIIVGIVMLAIILILLFYPRHHLEYFEDGECNSSTCPISINFGDYTAKRTDCDLGKCTYMFENKPVTAATSETCHGFARNFKDGVGRFENNQCTVNFLPQD